MPRRKAPAEWEVTRSTLYRDVSSVRQVIGVLGDVDGPKAARVRAQLVDLLEHGVEDGARDGGHRLVPPMSKIRRCDGRRRKTVNSLELSEMDIHPLVLLPPVRRCTVAGCGRRALSLSSIETVCAQLSGGPSLASELIFVCSRCDTLFGPAGVCQVAVSSPARAVGDYRDGDGSMGGRAYRFVSYSSAELGRGDCTWPMINLVERADCVPSAPIYHLPFVAVSGLYICWELIRSWEQSLVCGVAFETIALARRTLVRRTLNGATDELRSALFDLRERTIRSAWCCWVLLSRHLKLGTRLKTRWYGCARFRNRVYIPEDIMDEVVADGARWLNEEESGDREGHRCLVFGCGHTDGGVKNPNVFVLDGQHSCTVAICAARFMGFLPKGEVCLMRPRHRSAFCAVHADYDTRCHRRGCRRRARAGAASPVERFCRKDAWMTGVILGRFDRSLAPRLRADRRAGDTRFAGCLQGANPVQQYEDMDAMPKGTTRLERNCATRRRSDGFIVVARPCGRICCFTPMVGHESFDQCVGALAEASASYGHPTVVVYDFACGLTALTAYVHFGERDDMHPTVAEFCRKSVRLGTIFTVDRLHKKNHVGTQGDVAACCAALADFVASKIFSRWKMSLYSIRGMAIDTVLLFARAFRDSWNNRLVERGVQRGTIAADQGAVIDA